MEDRLIIVNGEDDYAIYKETTVPYISNGDDDNLPLHSFELISVIKDWGEPKPTNTNKMIGKVLLRNNYLLRSGLGVRGQGIRKPIRA